MYTGDENIPLVPNFTCHFKAKVLKKETIFVTLTKGIYSEGQGANL